MADTTDLSMDAPSDFQDYPEPTFNLVPPPEDTYPDRATLINKVQEHGKQHGYNIVVKTSSTPTEKKPGRAAKVWLRCDRGGTYRPRNGLTEETRKRKRTSRLMDCPFLIIASGDPNVGTWSVKVQDGRHNHGPSMDPPRAMPIHKVKRGQIEATPYDWPHDAAFNPFTSALVIIDMQRDFCEEGGYLSYQGYDITATRAIIPNLQHLLQAFRDAAFPIYFTREGHRPDLSTLSSRELHRSKTNPNSFGVGDLGPMGRLLVRGEMGHDIVPELYPLPNEPIIDKPGRGAFAHTDFELLLRLKGIKNLIVTGVTTDCCVSTTLREANDRGFDCLLLEDGCAAADINLHIQTCESVKIEGGVLGSVARLDDVVRAVDNFKRAAARQAARPEQPPTPTMSMAPSPTTPASILAGVLSTPLGPPLSMGSMGTPYMSDGKGGMAGSPGL